MLNQKETYFKLKLTLFLNVFYQMNFYCMRLSVTKTSLWYYSKVIVNINLFGIIVNIY